MPLFNPPDPKKLYKEKNVKGLLKALTHKDHRVRWSAAFWLDSLKDPLTFEPLIKALKKDPDEGVRKAVATALSSLNDPRTMDTLLAMLGRGGKERDIAAMALGRYGKTSAVEPIRAAYGEVLTDVALIALGNLRDQRATPALIELVKSTRAYDAILALKNTHDARAFPLLLEIAQSPDKDGFSRDLARAAVKDFDPGFDFNFNQNLLVCVWTTNKTNVFTLEAHNLPRADATRIFGSNRVVILSQDRVTHSASSHIGCWECKLLIEAHIQPSLPRNGQMPIGYELGDGECHTYS